MTDVTITNIDIDKTTLLSDALSSIDACTTLASLEDQRVANRVAKFTP